MRLEKTKSLRSKGRDKPHTHDFYKTGYKKGCLRCEWLFRDQKHTEKCLEVKALLEKGLPEAKSLTQSLKMLNFPRGTFYWCLKRLEIDPKTISVAMYHW